MVVKSIVGSMLQYIAAPPKIQVTYIDDFRELSMIRQRKIARFSYIDCSCK